MFKHFGLFLLLFPFTVLAQSDVDRVLFPVSSPEIGGAFGSRWATEHFIRNDGSAPVAINRDDCGPIACQVVIAPATSYRMPPATTKDHVWISAPRAALPQMYFSTVVRDVSRSVEPWGTSIPSATESDFRLDRMELLNVPSELTFRKNLRIYLIPQFVPGTSAEVTLAVRVFDFDAELATSPSRRMIAEKQYTLRDTALVKQTDYLAIFDLDHDFPGLQSAQRLRVEVERVGSVETKLWALLTVTNNNTQHVTLFTP